MQYNLNWQIKARPQINLKKIAKLMEQAARLLKIKAIFEVSILVVGDSKIRSLNKKYRFKDKVTDVLSFSQLEGPVMVDPSGQRNLGDIVVSWPQVKRQAVKYGFTAEKELAFLIIHGLLHLLGYDDKTQRQYDKMEKIQNKILASVYD
jgi:probable rRNA maturation factor